MDRRAFLLTGAAALGSIGLAGCTQSPAPKPSGSASPQDPDDVLRASVGADELTLIVAYRTAISDRPELAKLLTPFMAHHEAHLTRIDPEAASPEASPTPASPAPASPAPVSPTLAGSSAADVLAGLAAAERRARTARIAACDSAGDAMLARDLCLIAASEAQHAEVLGAAAAQERPQ